jgi:hypothetical protein
MSLSCVYVPSLSWQMCGVLLNKRYKMARVLVARTYGVLSGATTPACSALSCCAHASPY